MSGTPIREVFLKLQEEHFVEVVPGRPTRVAQIDVNRVKDYAFMRAALEASAVDAVCAHGLSEADKAQLEDLIHKQEMELQKPDKERFQHYDELFHKKIIELSGHPEIWSFVSLFNRYLRWAHNTATETSIDLKKAISDHKSIVNYLQQDRRTLARNRMLQHVNRVHERLTRLV